MTRTKSKMGMQPVPGVELTADQPRPACEILADISTVGGRYSITYSVPDYDKIYIHGLWDGPWLLIQYKATRSSYVEALETVLSYVKADHVEDSEGGRS